MAEPRRSSWAVTSMFAVLAVVVFAVVVLRSPAGNKQSTLPNDFIGRPAPDFTLPDLAGNDVTLSSLRGKVVVLDLWATWCPPCVAELPTNTAVAKKYADRGVVFYAVNLGESADTVNAFLKKHGLDTPILLDRRSVTAAAYSAQYIPLLVVIDAGGRIVAHDNVAPAEAEATLSKWIESALASGQAVERGSERPATRP